MTGFCGLRGFCDDSSVPHARPRSVDSVDCVATSRPLRLWSIGDRRREERTTAGTRLSRDEQPVRPSMAHYRREHHSTVTVNPYSAEAHRAVHEASHALAYGASGVPFRLVTIEPTGDYLGAVLLDEHPADPWIRGVVAAAGPIGEGVHARTLWRGPGPPDHLNHRQQAWDNGGHRDRAELVAAAAELGMAGQDPFTPRAERIVFRNMSTIRALAGELLQRGTMSYSEVAELVRVCGR